MFKFDTFSQITIKKRKKPVRDPFVHKDRHYDVDHFLMTGQYKPKKRRTRTRKLKAVEIVISKNETRSYEYKCSEKGDKTKTDFSVYRFAYSSFPKGVLNSLGKFWVGGTGKKKQNVYLNRKSIELLEPSLYDLTDIRFITLNEWKNIKKYLS